MSAGLFPSIVGMSPNEDSSFAQQCGNPDALIEIFFKQSIEVSNDLGEFLDVKKRK